MPQSAPKKAGPGRPKGAKNKITNDIKRMVLSALDKAGGENYLLKQAEKNPTAFMTLLGKILPTQITGDDENPVTFVGVVKRVIIQNKKDG